jgi:predicted anti-sigma-YlaC factor YlaD
MSCEEFQALVPELIAAGSVYTHPHLQNCDLCRALIVDLDMIAEEASRLDRPL